MVMGVFANLLVALNREIPTYLFQITEFKSSKQQWGKEFDSEEIYTIRNFNASGPNNALSVETYSYLF